jgi:hypothetical protein
MLCPVNRAISDGTGKVDLTGFEKLITGLVVLVSLPIYFVKFHKYPFQTIYFQLRMTFLYETSEK